MTKRIPVIERGLLAALWFCWGVGTLATGVLAWSAATNLSAPGCSFSGFNCDEVAASPYGRLLGVPLTTFGLVYFALAAFLLIAAHNRKPFGSLAVLAICLLSAVGVATGVWSLQVMVYELETMCLRCLAVHAANLGFVIAALGLLYCRWSRLRAGNARAIGLNTKSLTIAAVCGVVLAGWQYCILDLFHDRSELQIVQVQGVDRPIQVMCTDEESICTYYGGADAKHRIAMIVCYTCPTCRSLFERLSDVPGVQTGDIRIDVRFAPFSSTCNPLFERARPNYQACQLSRLALAVADVDNRKFAEFSTWLFEHQGELTATMAREEAGRLVSPVELERALDDERLDQRLASDIQVARRLRVTRLPLLVVPRGVVQGEFSASAAAAILAESGIDG